MPCRVAIGLLVSTLLPLGALPAAPPPPPPPGAVEKADSIVSPPTEAGLATYVNLFTPDVGVFEGDKKVSSTRAEFLAYLRSQTGLHFKVLHVSYGNPILVAETVSNFPEVRQPGAVYDCCFWARVATYHLAAGGGVDRVVFLENGAYWGPPERPE